MKCETLNHSRPGIRDCQYSDELNSEYLSYWTFVAWHSFRQRKKAPNETTIVRISFLLYKIRSSEKERNNHGMKWMKNWRRCKFLCLSCFVFEQKINDLDIHVWYAYPIKTYAGTKHQGKKYAYYINTSRRLNRLLL